MHYNEITEKHLRRLSDKIKDVMSAKGLDNTGGTANSLEVNQTQLLADGNIYFLDQGRAPGTFPPVVKMIEYVMTKLGVTGSEIKGAAFLVGRKIKREGTEIYKDKSKGIELDSLVDDMLDGLMEELPNEVAAEALKWL